MKPIRLMAGFFTVGIWTLLSRMLGFVREIMIAGFLGAGPVAEAFFIAFSLPNLFRRFFAEGAFNMAFVPMFSKKVEANDGAQRFAQDAFVGLGFIVTILTVIAVIFMPALVTLTAQGFRGSERFDLAVYYGRIAFPYILFISLAALFIRRFECDGPFRGCCSCTRSVKRDFRGGVDRNFPVHRSNARLLWHQSHMGGALAGLAQLALVWVAAKNAGYPLKIKRPRMTPELKRLAIIAAPAALAGGVIQINLLVGRAVASGFEGAVCLA